MILKFAGYDTIEAAKALVGFEFGLPEAERVELSMKASFMTGNLKVVWLRSKPGSMIGKVREVMRTGGVELLVVER